MASKNTYDVVLEKVGNQPLMTTKILCGTLGLGLAVAKGMVDKSPTTVAKGLDSDKALALFKELESIGNIVSIPGMEIKTKSPVVLTPRVITCVFPFFFYIYTCYIFLLK